MRNILANALTRLLGLSKQFVQILVPILQESAGRALSQLAPIALDVVRSLAESPHSGAQKREAAVGKIQSIAVAEGIRASNSLVNLAIEIAVQSLKR